MRRHFFVTLWFALSWHYALSWAHAEKNAPEKPPLPSAAALQAAEARLLDDVKDRLAAVSKQDLAKAWLDLAISHRDDPVGQCMLLIKTRELAQGAGDILLALEAIDALADRFEFNSFVVKASTLEDLARSILTMAARRQLLEAGSRLAEESLAAGQFEQAERFAKAASVAANHDHKLRRQTRTISFAIKYARKQAAAQLEAAIAARERLGAEPDDPSANEVVGLHECFAEQKWASGLERLQKSAHASLAEAARSELAAPREPRERLALANAWWQLAADDHWAGRRAQFVLRAVHWYRLAVTELDGQAKAKAKDRIDKAMLTITAGARFTEYQRIQAVELELAEHVALRLVKVPGGRAQDKIINPFYLSETEITQEQWLTMMTKNPSSQRGDGSLPVNDLTHEQAAEFISELNRSAAARDYEFRLPTPDEWLHACGCSFRHNEQQMSDMVNRQAWRQTNSKGRLHVVASLSPNSWGLFDMLGNCAEWTSDPRRVFGFNYLDRINAAKLGRQPLFVETPLGHCAKSVGFRIAADAAIEVGQ